MQNNSEELTSQSVEVDTDLFFSGAQRRKTVEDIKRVIGDGVQLTILTGEEGSGKTMICRMVEKEIPVDYITVYMGSTIESFDKVLMALSQNLDINTEDGEESGIDIAQKISTALQEKGKRLLIIFNCAEMMYLATIERILKLLDEVNKKQIRIQIILAGHKGLIDNLAHLPKSTVASEEIFEFPVNPLSLSETYAFLHHYAQYRFPHREENVFDPESAKKIYNISKGNFGIITEYADKTFESLDPETSEMGFLETLPPDEKEWTGVKEFSYWRFTQSKIVLSSILACCVLLAFVFFPEKEEKKSPDVAVVSEKKDIPEKIEPKKQSPALPQKKITLTAKGKTGNKPDTANMDSSPDKAKQEKSRVLQEAPVKGEQTGVGSDEVAESVEEKAAVDKSVFENQQPGPVDQKSFEDVEVTQKYQNEVGKAVITEADKIDENNFPVKEIATSSETVNKKTVPPSPGTKVDASSKEKLIVSENTEAAEVLLPQPDTNQVTAVATHDDPQLASASDAGESDQKYEDQQLSTSTTSKPENKDSTQPSAVPVESKPAAADNKEELDTEAVVEIVILKSANKKIRRYTPDTDDFSSQNSGEKTVAVDSGDISGGFDNSDTGSSQVKINEPIIPVSMGVDGNGIEREQLNNEEIVVLSEKKKLAPAIIRSVSTGKSVKKIAPAKILVPEKNSSVSQDISGRDLYMSRIDKGALWLQGNAAEKYTVQLMVLSSKQGEKNLVENFQQKNYQGEADKIYILKNDSDKVFVFYGVYATLEEARKASVSLPSFLVKGEPYAVSIKEIVAKITP